MRSPTILELFRDPICGPIIGYYKYYKWYDKYWILRCNDLTSSNEVIISYLVKTVSLYSN